MLDGFWSRDIDETKRAERVPLISRNDFDSDLLSAVKNAHKKKISLSLLFLDIDHFKKINDKYGHQTGDDVLVHVSKILLRVVGQRGRSYRYGGEELVVLLPQFLLNEAVGTAETIRQHVEVERWNDVTSSDVRVTISGGVAELRKGQKAADLLKAADEALYRAKKTGRNKVCAAEASQQSSRSKTIALIAAATAAATAVAVSVFICVLKPTSIPLPPIARCDTNTQTTYQCAGFLFKKENENQSNTIVTTRECAEKGCTAVYFDGDKKRYPISKRIQPDHDKNPGLLAFLELDSTPPYNPLNACPFGAPVPNETTGKLLLGYRGASMDVRTLVKKVYTDEGKFEVSIKPDSLPKSKDMLSLYALPLIVERNHSPPLVIGVALGPPEATMMFADTGGICNWDKKYPIPPTDASIDAPTDAVPVPTDASIDAPTDAVPVPTDASIDAPADASIMPKKVQFHVTAENNGSVNCKDHRGNEIHDGDFVILGTSVTCDAICIGKGGGEIPTETTLPAKGEKRTFCK